MIKVAFIHMLKHVVFCISNFDIIKPGEATYCQGKEGGVFLGLKKEMISRAEKLAEK